MEAYEEITKWLPTKEDIFREGVAESLTAPLLPRICSSYFARLLSIPASFTLNGFISIPGSFFYHRWHHHWMSPTRLKFDTLFFVAAATVVDIHRPRDLFSFSIDEGDQRIKLGNVYLEWFSSVGTLFPRSTVRLVVWFSKTSGLKFVNIFSGCSA